MSNIYNLEPPTKGKVILKTTLGDIDIELWPKEAPKAVRNFVQLCMEGYYDGTIFHRVLKDFMAQGGDASGSGSGEESIYGHPFADEFHSRLKFNHRGLVACANAGTPHSNGSQFFITLDRCDHLDRKHTIFGKVTGESIYNAMHLNDLETDEDDRPMHPPVIIETEILWNPFEDIVARSTKEEREAEALAKKAAEEAALRKEKKSRKKNVGLLSFGEEAETEDQEADGVPSSRRRGIRSAHDVIEDARLLREKTEAAEALAKQEEAAEQEHRRVRATVREALGKKGRDKEEDDTVGADGDMAERAADRPEAGATDAEDFAARMRAAASARRKDMGDEPPPRAREETNTRADGSEGGDEDDEHDEDEAGPSAMEERREQALLGKAAPAQQRISKRVRVDDAELLTEWQRRNAEFKQRKKIAGAMGAADKAQRMKAFQMRLRVGKSAAAAAADAAAAPKADVEAAGDQAYDGKVRKDLDHDKLMPAAWRLDKYLDADGDGDVDLSLDALRAHTLVYNKARPGDDMARNDNVDDLVVLDPLAKEGARGEKYNRVKAREKKMGREWVAQGQRSSKR